MQTTMLSFATHASRIFPDNLWHAGDKRRLYGWLLAFPFALKRKLRSKRDVPELATVLAEEDIEKLRASLPEGMRDLPEFTYVTQEEDWPPPRPPVRPSSRPPACCRGSATRRWVGSRAPGPACCTRPRSGRRQTRASRSS